MCCTIEPFGVVLCGPQGRHVPQTAVNNRVAAGEISHCSSVDFSTLSYHGCRVVSRVVGTAGHTADGLQDAGDVRDRASRTHGHESISAAGEQTTAVQQEDTDVVLTLILIEKRHLISHTLQFIPSSAFSHVPVFISHLCLSFALAGPPGALVYTPLCGLQLTSRLSRHASIYSKIHEGTGGVHELIKINKCF